MVNLVKALYTLQPPAGRRLWALGAALLVALLTLAGGGKRLLEAYEGLTTTDQMVKVSAILSGAERRAIPVTLIEVDDETRAKWGNPVITPHAAIAGLIAASREAGARAILVDLDLSSDDPGLPADPVLLAELSGYAPEAPPLFIVRAIRFRANGGAQGPAFIADSYRLTPYDAALQARPNVFWVVALPTLGGDRVVRRIRLWQTVCDGASGVAFPSAALAVSAVLRRKQAELNDFLASRVAQECGAGASARLDWPPQQSRNATLPFVVGDTKKPPGLRAIEEDGRASELFRRIGAWSLMRVQGDDVQRAGPVDPAVFNDRAVLIGATHADSRDTYATPMGSMPGVVILANAVAMADIIVGTPEASATLKSALALLLFVVAAYFGTKFQAAPATLLIGLASLGMLMIVARLLGFAAGVESVALGLTVFALYKVADSIAGIIHDWRQGLGWRALLKSRPGGKH